MKQAPKGYYNMWHDTHEGRESIMVVEEENEPVFTGLFTPTGGKIMRFPVKEPMGFDLTPRKPRRKRGRR